jgi:hypothetical protein
MLNSYVNSISYCLFDMMKRSFVKNGYSLFINIIVPGLILIACGGGGGKDIDGKSGAGGGGGPAPPTKITSRVSVDSGGAEANGGNSSAPSISSTGRYAAFASMAFNLVSVDTNGRIDIFVHDRDTDVDGIFDEPAFIKTVRVSVSSTGAQATTNNSFAPSISSTGSDLIGIGGDTNGLRDIFVHDRDTNVDGIFDEPAFIKTVRVSVSSTGAQATTNNSFAPSISSKETLLQEIQMG